MRKHPSISVSNNTGLTDRQWKDRHTQTAGFLLLFYYFYCLLLNVATILLLWGHLVPTIQFKSVHTHTHTQYQNTGCAFTSGLTSLSLVPLCTRNTLARASGSSRGNVWSFGNIPQCARLLSSGQKNDSVLKVSSSKFSPVDFPESDHSNSENVSLKICLVVFPKYKKNKN